MTSDEMRFKARNKSRAQEEGIRPQVMLQNFMFERFFAFYRLKAYTIETVIAEKLEAILSLGNVSTRPRDYYDAYMLTTAIKFNIRKLRLALKATIAHRGSLDAVRAWKSVLNGISASSVMNERWRKYQREFPFAADVDFDRICKQLGALFSKVL